MRVAAVVFVLALSGAAHASIFDVYGMGARGLGMGGALTSNADDYSATFYNPAALAKTKQITFGGGFTLTLPRLEIGRGLPVCLDGAAACSQTLSAWSDRESVIPESFSGFSLGWLFPFGGIFEDRLAFGIVIYFPTINLVRAEALDPQTPQFYMYQNLPDQLVILASLAYEPVDWFSFGIGAQVLANVFGNAAFSIDIVGGGVDQSDLTVELRPTAAATAGLHFEPVEGLQIGVSYRQEIGLEFAMPAEIDAAGAVQLGLNVAGSVLYTPHQINAGISYRIASIGLTASVEIGYAMWSLAPDPSPTVEVTLGGAIVDAFGLEGALDIGKDTPPIDLGFRDTITPRLGLEWEALDWLRVWGGYYYRPTPAPRASGPYNYLDNDVHAVSFGAEFTFPDPIVPTRPISVAIGNQFGILPRRTVHKANSADPVGDLDHGGFTYSLSLTINHRF